MSAMSLSHPRFEGPGGEFEQYVGFSNDELSLDPNAWNRVFVLSIDEGTAYLMGRGKSRNPMQAQGFIGAHLMDNDSDGDGTASQIGGRWRLAVRTKNNGTHVDTLASGSLSQIDSRKADGTPKDDKNLHPQPRTDGELTTKEYEISFEVKPRSATVVDAAPASGNTEFLVDGTEAERTA